LNDLQEGLRLAELNNERYWLSRFPNTLGWAFDELQEVEQAIQLNREGAKVARENQYGKPEANSHLNLAHLYLNVGEPENALQHLRAAERIFEADVWFRWRYNIRLKAEMARYWMRKGDSRKAAQSAAESLALAEPRKARKHMAWAHKLLGDIAVLEERFSDARDEYEKALAVLRQHRCPTVEWKILLSAAQMASAYRDVGLAEHYRGRCHSVIGALADSIRDDRQRQRYLKSEAIRTALS
jgi:tetratricopeptide (TPR) repeat protein